MKVWDLVGLIVLMVLGWLFLKHSLAASACFFVMACVLVPWPALKITAKVVLFVAFGVATMLCYDWLSCTSFAAATLTMLETIQRQLNPREDITPVRSPYQPGD